MARVALGSAVRVARGHFYLSLAALAVGGALAFAMRWSLAYPGRAVPVVGAALLPATHGVVGPAEYTALFSLHGTAMIFFALGPLLHGWLGNLAVPLLIGARRTALPRLSLAGLALSVAGAVTLTAGALAPDGAPAAGWTSYPPLASLVGARGAGQSLWCVAVLLVGAGTVCTAVNLLTTVALHRCPGMTLARLPLTVWGLALGSLLNVLFVPVLLAGTGLLLADRMAGTHTFSAGMTGESAGGDPLLYQHLFWIFGHPEVYILILPVWGVVSDLLAVFARKPAFGYRSTVLAMGAVTALSALVYGHHMFVAGISAALSTAFMTLTVLVSVPSAVFFLNWLGTLWRGAIRFTAPMCYALAVVVVFAAGGLTGMYLGAVSTDVYLHDSYFVVGHFHLVMAAALLFGAFAAVQYWFPKAYGRRLSEPLAIVHCALTLVLALVTFGAMLWLGRAGMLRRIFTPAVYGYLRPTLRANELVSHAAFALVGAQLLFVANLVYAWLRGAPAGDNPWESATLEGATSSPPPLDACFVELPTALRGPHEYAHPDAPPGRDWLAQHDPGRAP